MLTTVRITIKTRINQKFILYIKYIVKQNVNVREETFWIKLVSNLFRVSKPEFTIATTFQVHNLSNFVLSAHKICLTTGSYVWMSNNVEAWGHHLSLNMIHARWITMDHTKNISNETKKLSLFHCSMFFVIISIMIIEKIQKTGLSQYTIKYRIDAFLSHLRGFRNLFSFSLTDNHFFCMVLY